MWSVIWSILGIRVLFHFLVFFSLTLSLSLRKASEMKNGHHHYHDETIYALYVLKTHLLWIHGTARVSYWNCFFSAFWNDKSRTHINALQRAQYPIHISIGHGISFEKKKSKRKERKKMKKKSLFPFNNSPFYFSFCYAHCTVILFDIGFLISIQFRNAKFLYHNRFLFCVKNFF